ncbi:MAG: hypothetical protein HW373_1057, partial [Deltaproteobacteria bacterium]|nr:hypothetical protein [Deltaproteobacteria bacterium]
VICQLLIGFFWGGAWAQVADPTKALIGTWEGTVAVYTGANERTLIIESVKPNAEGGWIAQGRYGITRQTLGRQTYDVSIKDNEIIVEFVTGAKSPGRLKLIGDSKLEGTLNIVTKAGAPNRTFKLEKVEPKVGELK